MGHNYIGHNYIDYIGIADGHVYCASDDTRNNRLDESFLTVRACLYIRACLDKRLHACLHAYRREAEAHDERQRVYHGALSNAPRRVPRRVELRAITI